MKGVFAFKFFNLLRTFDEAEFKTLEKWLASPWSNSNQNLITLFQKIKKYYPDFDDSNLTKEKLFKQVKSGKKYSDAWMNNLLSKANLKTEEFLIFENLRRNENLKKSIIAEEFQVRKLEHSFFKTADAEIARLESKPVKDWEDYLDLLKLNRRIYHHPNQNPRMSRGKELLLKMDENLTLAYLLEKALIINEKIFRNRILKGENHDVKADLKEWRMASEGVAHLAIDFYRKRFGYTEENMVNEFLKLRKEFMIRVEELNPKEQQVHLYYLINDATFLRKRRLIDLHEVLPLFKLGLKIGILTPNKSISRVLFVMIVTVSNACKEFDFTNGFIEKYKSYLPNELQFDAKNWAMAHTEMKKGDLEKSLNILLSVESTSHYFQKTSKILTLQIYFDLFLNSSSYHSYMLSFCDAFEKWIRRDESRSDFNKVPFLRFIQKCRIMAKIYSNPDFDSKKILGLFDNEKNIHAINWLTEKQQEIMLLKKERSCGEQPLF